MKKQLFFAVALAGMMAACSSSDEIAQRVDSPFVDSDEQTEIKIGASNEAVTTTRGKGTVGGVENDQVLKDKSWDSETLYIFMTETGTTNVADPTTYFGANTQIKLFNNQKVTAPAAGAADKLVKVIDDQNVEWYNYYPMKGQFDFYGYHVDDATVDATDPTAVTFTIDGSQDILVGKANFAADKQAAQDANAEGIDDLDVNATAYSGHAARHGVQPTINFKHMLTRLTFEVVAGDDEAAGTKQDGHTGAMHVKAITVKSPAEGKLKVVDPTWDGTTRDRIEWTGKDADITLTSGEEDGQALTQDYAAFTGVSGDNTLDAIFVRGGVDSYEFSLSLEQEVELNSNGDKEKTNPTYTGTFTLPGDGATGTTFELGYSYKVKIKLYGLNEIKVSVELDKWLDGGETEEENNDHI